MRFGKCLTLVLVASTLAVGPTDVTGQFVRSPYRFVEPGQDLGPFVAWMITDRGTADLGPKSGPMYGLQYALRINDPMQFAATAGYFSTERELIDPSAEGGPQSIGVESLGILVIGGRIQLNLTGARTWNRLMPYVLGGIGIAIDVTGEPTCGIDAPSLQCSLAVNERFTFNNSVLGQLGVGVAWLPAERIGVRFSFHDNIWRIETPPGWRDPALEIDPAPSATEWLNNFQLTLGLSYWF